MNGASVPEISPDHEQLLGAARDAARYSHAPYSGNCVGAALQSATGEIFTGCNVEAYNYSTTICAERSALVKAISEGHRAFIAIAVASSVIPHCYPCGVCREALSEFGDMLVIVGAGDFKSETVSLKMLLPLHRSP